CKRVRRWHARAGPHNRNGAHERVRIRRTIAAREQRRAELSNERAGRRGDHRRVNLPPALDAPVQQLASDNQARICPEALAALPGATRGPPPASGDDAGPARAADRLRALFEPDCEIFFVFGGTAANALALAALCQSYHAVICHPLAHVE